VQPILHRQNLGHNDHNSQQEKGALLPPDRRNQSSNENDELGSIVSDEEFCASEQEVEEERRRVVKMVKLHHGRFATGATYGELMQEVFDRTGLALKSKRRLDLEKERRKELRFLKGKASHSDEDESEETSERSQASLEAGEAERTLGADLDLEMFETVMKSSKIRRRSTSYQIKLRKLAERDRYEFGEDVTKTNLYPRYEDWADDMLDALQSGSVRARRAAAQLVCNQARKQLKAYCDQPAAPQLNLHLKRVSCSLKKAENLFRRIDGEKNRHCLETILWDVMDEDNRATFAKNHKLFRELDVGELRSLCLEFGTLRYGFWEEATKLLHFLMLFQGYRYRMDSDDTFEDFQPAYADVIADLHSRRKSRLKPSAYM